MSENRWTSVYNIPQFYAREFPPIVYRGSLNQNAVPYIPREMSPSLMNYPLDDLQKKIIEDTNTIKSTLSNIRQTSLQHGNIIDVDLFNKRKKYIEILYNIQNELKNISNEISTCIDSSLASQQSDFDKINSIVQMQKPPPGLAIMKKETIPEKVVVAPAKVAGVKELNKTQVAIGNSLTILAANIKSGEIKTIREGVLYYLTDVNHFAIKFSGIILHGNIGRVFYNEKNIYGVRKCRYGKECNKTKCEYYHNPLEVSGDISPERNVRNYISGSVYSFGYDKNTKEYKKMCDVDSIDSDIISLSNDDIERYNDQTMHMLLCCIILNTYNI